MKILITANFHVFVAQQGKADRRVSFARGVVIDGADVPAGQSAGDWIAKGLAKDATPETPAAPAT